jgi:hypothetical protein
MAYLYLGISSTVSVKMLTMTGLEYSSVYFPIVGRRERSSLICIFSMPLRLILSKFEEVRSDQCNF